MKKENEKEKNEQLAAAFQAHLQKLALPYRTKRTETDGEFAKIHLDFDGFACTLTGTAGYALGLSFLEYETSASTMTVRLRFRDDGMYYDLYDMENLADDAQFETLCFHNVRTPQAADTAAKKLIDGLNRHSALLQRIAADDALYAQLYENKLKDMATAMTEKNSDLQKLKTAPDKAAAEACLYTLDTFLGLGALDQSRTYKQWLAKGETKKAVEKLESMRQKQNLTVFETRFLEALKAGAFTLNEETRSKAAHEIDAKKYQGIYTVAALVLSFALWFGLSRLCSFLGAKIAFDGADLLTSGTLSLFICLLACIFTYPVLFKLLVRLTNKKHAARIIEASGIAEKPYSLFVRIAPVVFICVAAASLYAGSCGLALGNDAVLRRDTGKLQTETCSYSDFTFYTAEGYTENDGRFTEGQWVCAVSADGKTVWQSDVPLEKETYDALCEKITENGAKLQFVHDNTQIDELNAAAQNGQNEK